jgi:hypothetical protein
MNPDTGVPAEVDAGRLNTRLALLMFCVVAAPCLLLDALANDPCLLEWIHRVGWDQAIQKKQIPIYCYYDHFIDSADRLLHQDLPAADFSRGGVYLVGASSLAWALRIWDLPASTRPLIQNFAIGGSNHADEFDLVRYLVEEEGLLRAGGEKTLVVFGISYHMTHNARLPDTGPHDFFPRLWASRGFYRVDPDGSIHRSGLNPLWKHVIVERAKLTGLLRELVNLAYTPFKPARVLNPGAFKRRWTRLLGPRWKEKIELDLASLARTLDYLRQRGAKVLVIDMPRASWNGEVPIEQEYRKRMRGICDRAGVEVLDLSHTIPDDDFADSTHLSPSGIERFQAAVMDRFLDHLRRSGSLSPGEPSGPGRRPELPKTPDPAGSGSE